MCQKMTPMFGALFQMCIFDAAVLQIGRLLSKSTGFVHTYVSKTWCSFTYGSSGAGFVFWSFVCNGEAEK